MIIRSITMKDFPFVVDTMVDAFINDDLYAYFFTDAKRRVRFMKSFMKFRLKFGIKYGKVYVTDDLKGLAIWLSPNTKMNFIDMLILGGINILLFKCDFKERKRILRFTSFIDKMGKESINQPFFHLSPICVAKDYQRKGYGKELINIGLQESIKTKVPCYLETQSNINVGIYKKLGFKEVKRESLTESNIENICMIYNYQS